jgi:hypothetical protein
MPGGDGTGPAGMGSMTGRAAGYCAGYSAPGYVNPVLGAGWGGFGYGRRWGRGRGWGRSRGWGRGFGWRGGFYPTYAYPGYGYPGYSYGYPYVPEMTSQQEAEILKEQAKAMQEDISSINERIKELESAKKSEGK